MYNTNNCKILLRNLLKNSGIPLLKPHGYEIIIKCEWEVIREEDALVKAHNFTKDLTEAGRPL